MNKKSIFTGKEVKIGEGHDNIIMAIESSCDETACAIVKNGREVVANVVASQIKTHAQFGGVIPEIAAREHLAAGAIGRNEMRVRSGDGVRTRLQRRMARVEFVIDGHAAAPFVAARPPAKQPASVR